MRLPKIYGESKTNTCPFCSKPAMSMSVQKVPVCKNHVEARLPELKCACGGWLEMREGKWGPFFLCLKCGPISLKKALDMMQFMKPKEIIQVKAPSVATGTAPKAPTRKPVIQQQAHQIVRSDDPRFFD